MIKEPDGTAAEQFLTELAEVNRVSVQFWPDLSRRHLS